MGLGGGSRPPRDSFEGLGGGSRPPKDSFEGLGGGAVQTPHSLISDTDGHPPPMGGVKTDFFGVVQAKTAETEPICKISVNYPGKY